MKLIMENWRAFTIREIGMSQAALGVSDDHYKNIMGKPDIWKNTLPIHVKGFLYYLSGRTKTFTSSDLKPAEKNFLKEKIKQQIESLPNKESYIIAYQSGNNYPDADLSWDEIEIKESRHKFSLFLGQCIVRVDKLGNLRIIDHYDFQNERSTDLHRGSLWKDIKQSWSLIWGDKEVPSNPYVALRTMAPYRERLTDYKGYPVDILL